jgi:hypothetical protein
VSSTPSKLDSVALNTAAGTSPRAVAVRATDDETVEGKAHKKNRPVRRLSSTRPAVSASSSKPKSGKAKNVHS